jgi:hypothetical protein
LRYNEKSSSFEVAIKVFIDDLEKGISKSGISNLKIGTDNESSLAEEHIAHYLDQHFTITIDDAKLKPHFIGKELTDDLIAIWCYVEYTKPNASAKKCTVDNKILFDVHDDQRNIMDIRMNSKHKDYTILEPGRSTWSYTF